MQVWLYSIDASGDQNWVSCIDCENLETGTSLFEDNSGNYVIGGGGINENRSVSTVPIIVWVDSAGGDVIQKRYYGTGDDGWITSLSNDPDGNLFAVCYLGGKSLILDEKGGEILHEISVNVTEPGWWASLQSPEGYVAADRVEAYAVANNGTLLWHTIFQQNSTAKSRSFLIMNDEGNYVIASPYHYEDTSRTLLVELDNTGAVKRRIILDINAVFSLNENSDGNYEIIGGPDLSGSLYVVDKNGQILSTSPVDYNLPGGIYFCKSGTCYSEPANKNQIRLVQKDSAGDVVFDKQYQGGDFYDYPKSVIETHSGDMQFL
ncbi:hypothetical protein [Methanogenium cariaci]|uniref:hypothetical protein n=1 Tax=Methanogenium cariaci TaxID=2197 RepID=UPI00078670EB|nr:hypothetical protein [Methanogenium cariaci]